MKTRIQVLLGALALLFPATRNLSAQPDAPGAPMNVTYMPITHADKDVDERLEALKRMGVTSIQTYIYWNQVEKTPGVFDWSDYDADVAAFQRHGLKWVPFVIVGPWYVTPEFVRRDPQIVKFRCLEHDRESAMPSIWCERTREYFRNYLKEFTDHYRPMGVIESIDLGISGDYGEAIYSVIGNWPNAYHSHLGYWCGDALARADFRRAVQELYPAGIDALNAAWHSHYATFADVHPFLPAHAPSERAWQEFLRWYRRSMTSYADYCLGTVRTLFPQTDLYLCTGGDMAPEHGSDFSAQAKLAAHYGAGVRITNESSSFPMNVRLTRMVDAAARFYGAYVGHEPAAIVTPTGMLGRIFNAVTAGARQLFFYDAPGVLVAQDGRFSPGEFGQYLDRYHDVLRVSRPVVPVAVYQPNPTQHDTPCDHKEFGDLLGQIRRFVDYDLLDDRMIEDGALRAKTILIVAGASVMEAGTTARMEAWVRSGGIVFLLGRQSTDWDGSAKAFDELAGLTPQSDEVQGISELEVSEPKFLTSITGLNNVMVTVAYTALQPDCELLLTMKYDTKLGVAWQRRLGQGEVFTYFGPMDLKQEEGNWMVSQKLPLRFLQDCIQGCVADGRLKEKPSTLNLMTDDVYEVQTDAGLWILNMGSEARKVGVGDATVEVAPRSIKAPAPR